MPACRFCQTPYQGDARFCPACGRRLDSTPTAAGSSDPQSGRLFGNKYRAVRIVGEGGMGVVYEGVQTNVDQRVAIKILHARFAGRPDLVQRFENEARACARLHDPHIVTLHDFGREDDGTFYLVMEYVAGPSLAEFINEQGPLPEDLAVDLTVQLSEALSTAHAAGVVHRDLKPNNVILLRSASGRHFVKLLDFGIARVPDGSGGPLTATGDVFGTPEYMSPEQCRGERADERTDVYATGVILYHMLTGALPYQATTPISLVMAKVNNPPERPEARRPDLSPWLAHIVMRAIEREPAARYASMGEFRDDLERWRGTPASGRLVPSRPPVLASVPPVSGAAQAAAAPAERLATAPTLARPVSLPAETTLSRAKRGRAGLYVGVALGVAVAAAALFFALRGGARCGARCRRPARRRNAERCRGRCAARARRCARTPPRRRPRCGQAARRPAGRARRRRSRLCARRFCHRAFAVRAGRNARARPGVRGTPRPHERLAGHGRGPGGVASLRRSASAHPPGRDPSSRRRGGAAREPQALLRHARRRGRRAAARTLSLRRPGRRLGLSRQVASKTVLDEPPFSRFRGPCAARCASLAA